MVFKSLIETSPREFDVYLHYSTQVAKPNQLNQPNQVAKPTSRLDYKQTSKGKQNNITDSTNLPTLH